MTTAAVPTGMMKAIVRERYGPADILHLEEVDKPDLTDDGVLVRVRAASLNRGDWYTLTGMWAARPATGLRRPKERLIGVDFSGTVEAVGRDVTGVQPGDEVFGGRTGALAEYVCARARSVALKPSHVSFEEAAAVPGAGLTALQALRAKAQVQPGQKVLINGASGGVGTMAVQIAKALGAEVTAVCSTGNVEQARSIGADHVVDYTREDFTRSGRRYDVLFDNAGSKSWRACARVLEPKATVVLVGGKMGSLLGPLPHFIGMLVPGLGSSRKVAFFVAKFNKADIETLRELLDTGKLKPVIDRRYPLSETAEAFSYLGEGHARGKVVVTL